MKKLVFCVAAAALLTTGVARAEETWKGTITDAMCAARHSAEKHGDNPGRHRDCVEKCIKGGDAYVFVSGEKVYKIANQDFADLEAHAAHEVMLTGEMKDDTITVSKIVMPEKK